MYLHYQSLYLYMKDILQEDVIFFARAFLYVPYISFCLNFGRDETIMSQRITLWNPGLQ